MTTEKKTRSKSIPAEIIGSFNDVIRRDSSHDGRNLYAFFNDDGETFILASTELQAWQALRPSLGELMYVSRASLARRYREELLKRIEENDNGDADQEN